MRTRLGLVSVLGLDAQLLTGCGASTSSTGFDEHSLRTQGSEAPTSVSISEPLSYQVSGSRLTALGPNLQAGLDPHLFHDSTLDIDCNFAPTAAGQYVCMPPLVEVVFTDAACAEAAFWNNYPGWPESAWVSAPSDWASLMTVELSAVPVSRAAFRVGEVVRAGGSYTDDLYWIDSQGVCQPGAHPRGKEFPEVRRLVPADVSRLVGSTQQRVPLSEGGELVRLIADDGAEVTAGMQLSTDRYCSMLTTGSCVPTPVVGQDYSSFSDASCAAHSYTYPDRTQLPSGPIYGVKENVIHEIARIDEVWAADIATGVVLNCYTSTNTWMGERAQSFAAVRDVTAELPLLQRSVDASGLSWFVGHERDTGRTVFAALDEFAH